MISKNTLSIAHSGQPGTEVQRWRLVDNVRTVTETSSNIGDVREPGIKPAIR